ncbi:MAG: DEAD/DEAH box helicase [Acidimicrobiales bacterium]
MNSGLQASLQVTWTKQGAAFWGWEQGVGLPGDKLRRLAGAQMGSWWATREADLEPIVVAVPDHDVLHVSGLLASPRVVLDLMADRYPTSSWSPSARWLHGACSLAIDAAVTGLILPNLETTGLRWRAGWALIDHPSLDHRIDTLLEVLPPVVVAGGTIDGRGIIDQLADAACRRGLVAASWKPPLPRSRSAHVVATRRVTTALTDNVGVVVGENERHEATFAQLSGHFSELRSLAEGSTPLTSRGRLEPGDPDENWELRFEVVSLDDPTKSATWLEVLEGAAPAQALVDGGSLRPVRRYTHDLSLRLAAIVPGLDRLDDNPGTGVVDLDLDEVALLLVDGLDLCQRSGAPVLVPKGLVRTRLRLTAEATPTEGGGVSSDLGSAMVDVDWALALGDEKLTEQELQALAQSHSGLVQLRGEWVRVDAAQARSALQELVTRRSDSSSMTPAEVVRTAATAFADVDVELTTGEDDSDGEGAGGWLTQLLAGLPDDELRESREPEIFVGQLRPYQRRALSWMQFLRRLGLGGCLADDMGLGKTPTTLAHVLSLAGDRPSLVLCPLSVVHNWEAESARFTPTLRIAVVHGSGRPTGSKLVATAAEADLVISTYGTATRDVETLATIDWELVICDEAQAIKNHHTHAARAVRELSSQQTLALTGTPVENRLAELWSILDAANPGMLGGVTWFRDRFATPIEQRNDERALEGMRRLTGPFVLRRTKADKSLVPDLPDKVEQIAWATLTPEQAGLYRAVLNDFLAEAEAEDGMKRRGLILATLTKLKQICNHPAHFLADGSTVAGRSGKLDRFDVLIDELLDAGDRALVFTQYRGMGELLADHMRQRLDINAAFLHGGVSRARREKMVEDFQAGSGPPVQLVSLKAGGTGLNLTAATRVIHYDRWWNPAVEDQATDRAWRIGQTRTVFVHKLVCQGTLEERIDDLLQEKKDLADRAVGSGESWLTEMNTDDLRDLLSLGPESVDEP